ncbi:MAG TPA: hypothetical protein VFQ53_34930 [Kofleriaceae bacterium]|nr:hypothetical protein [Kofleriaceae bacterium]
MRNLAKTLLLCALTACGGDDECTIDTTYDPPINAASFKAAVDNPLYPLVPGTRFVYMAGSERVDIEVLTTTRTILGITATEVHDVASVNGETIEDTIDWFAQDQAGNVWYLGEDTKELEGGQVVSTEGSWEAGVDGAKPGIIIPASPVLDQPYRQEYLACEAEDMGKVVSTNASVTVPVGAYTGCLETEDTTPLEPDVNEHKFYCPGVGLVLSIDTETGEREELIQRTP